MKKRIATLSMMSLLALGTLTGCGKVNKKTVDGESVIVTVGNHEFTASQLFKNYTQTTSGASAYYNAIYDLLVRNRVDLKTDVMEAEVNTQIDTFTQKAKDNASSNGTSYKKELSALLKDEGVDSISELKEVYYLQQMKTALEDSYYEKNMDELTLEYSRVKAPYHVSHILVKLDSEGGSLYDTKISSDNAVKLGSVVDSLVDTKITFGQTAKEMSDDNDGSSSSANMFGDLGLMDLDTSFVPEFKYSVFAYDAFLNKDSSIKAKEGYTSIANELGLDKSYNFSYDGQDDSYNISLESVLNTVNEIPYGVVAKLGTLKESTPVPKDKETFTANGKKRDFSESAYPRNVLFNQYFNDHGIGVITDVGYTGDSTNFKSIPSLSKDKVLCDEKGNPILVTRASASYEGVHFITINKSPFALNDEEFKDYYDTEVPSSTSTKNDTFVTAIKTDRDVYQDRSNKIKSSVKGFDKYLNYRIYESLLYKTKNADGTYTLNDGISIDKEIVDLVQKYIDGQKENTDYTNEATTDETLSAYAQKLVLQDKEKAVKQLKLADIQKLYPEVLDDAFVKEYDR